MNQCRHHFLKGSLFWAGLVMILCLFFQEHQARAKKRAPQPKNSRKKTVKKKHQNQSPPQRRATTTKPQQRAGKSRLPAARKIILPALPDYGKRSIVLKALLRHAYRHNPTLIRLRRTVRVFQQREKRAGPWPDIKVGVSGTNFPLPTFNPTTTAMSGIVYSISQRFPILGRLSLQKKLAKLDTKMMQELVREKAIWVCYHVRKAVHWLIFLRHALQVERELHQLTGQAAAVARTRYTVGKAPQQHYLQALTLQSVIRTRMVLLVAKERIWRHRLGRLLGAKGLALLGQIPKAQPSLPMLNAQQTIKTAFVSRGSIRRWKVSVRQAKQLLSLARIRYWPDVTLQLSVRQRFPNPIDQGLPFISLGIKVPIPSWGNAARHGFVREAMSRHHLARSRIRELQVQFREQTRITLTRIRQYQLQIRIAQRHTIPLAMQTYRSAMSNYQVDKVDFLTLLSNLRRLFKERLRLVRLRTIKANLTAQLHAISGNLPKAVRKASQKIKTKRNQRKLE